MLVLLAYFQAGEAVSLATAGAVAGIVASVASVGGVVSTVIAEHGRRLSNLHVEAANSELCAETTAHFADTHMMDFMKVVLRDAPNGPGLGQIAEKMAVWCAEKAQTGRRRAEMGEGEAGQWAEYITALEERYPAELARSRREGHKHLGLNRARQAQIIESFHNDWIDDELTELLEKEAGKTRVLTPSLMYDQCMGYAMALSVMAKSGHSNAADIFAVNSKGQGYEKIEACGSVVNTVNKAISSNLVPELDIVEIDGGSVVVVKSSRLADTLAGQFGVALTTVTVAGGYVLTKLFDMCDQYADLALA